MNPRTETVAFRVWSYAAPRGWDLTIAEIAEEIGEPMASVRAICCVKGWHHRVRHVSEGKADSPWRNSSKGTVIVAPGWIFTPSNAASYAPGYGDEGYE